MKRLMGVLVFAVVFVFSWSALGEPCPPVDVNLSVADQAQEWWMVLLDFLLQLVTPIAIAVITALAGIAVRKWGRKLDADKQEAIIRLTDGIITSGLSFAEEQGRKALRVDKVKTESADKLQSAVDYVKQQLDASGLPQVAEDELVKLIEAKLHQERARPDGVIEADGAEEGDGDGEG
jgi:hypothetical protein